MALLISCCAESDQTDRLRKSIFVEQAHAGAVYISHAKSLALALLQCPPAAIPVLWAAIRFCQFRALLGKNLCASMNDEL
jgi:hypothetical protein